MVFVEKERIRELTERVWKTKDRETIRKSLNSIRYLNGINEIISGHDVEEKN